jgi:hypothetical protein
VLVGLPFEPNSAEAGMLGRKSKEASQRTAKSASDCFTEIGPKRGAYRPPNGAATNHEQMLRNVLVGAHP